MDHHSIISAIEAEIAKLQRARTLLSDFPGSRSVRGTRTATPRKAVKRAIRKLSPEGRKRIADAQRKRWAAENKQRKSAATGSARAKAAKRVQKSVRPAKAAKKTAPASKSEAGTTT
jgi:hypothetical protein